MTRLSSTARAPDGRFTRCATNDGRGCAIPPRARGWGTLGSHVVWVARSPGPSAGRTKNVDNSADVKNASCAEGGAGWGRRLCPAHVAVSAARRLTCGASSGIVLVWVGKCDARYRLSHPGVGDAETSD